MKSFGLQLKKLDELNADRFYKLDVALIEAVKKINNDSLIEALKAIKYCTPKYKPLKKEYERLQKKILKLDSNSEIEVRKVRRYFDKLNHTLNGKKEKRDKLNEELKMFQNLVTALGRDEI
jgi:predicted RNase H-like nuclease (RuvC/YqgF family)